MTLIKNLKVGDRLADTDFSPYGRFINRYIHSIRTTKSGRYVIEVKDQYEYIDGKISEPRIAKMYNGAVIGDTITNLHN